MYLAFSAALILIVISNMLISHKIKLPFDQRMLHIRSVIIAVVLGIVVISNFVLILDLLDKFTGAASIRPLLFSFLPQANVSAAFFWIITLLSCIIVSVIYCITLGLVNALWLKRVAKKPYLQNPSLITRSFNWLSSISYDISGAPEVKNSWVNVGHWLRVMRNIFSGMLIAEAIAVTIYLQLNLTFIDDFLLSKLIKSFYFVPVITWFLLDQIVIYLQADLKPEEIKLETEESRLSHYGDYKKLIAIYDDLFGGQALISYYINETAPEQALFSGPTAEQKKRVDNPALLEAICRSVNNLVSYLPTNYIDALVDLINGKSVAVFDSISGEFQLFYLAFLQKNLFLRRKALVICDTEGQVNDVINQFRDIFKRLNKAHEIWQIGDISTLLAGDNSDIDILVCTEEQLLQNRIEEKYQGFYQSLHDIFVMHGYDIMCRQNPFAFRFYNSLKKKNAQFVFLVPENSRDIDSALETRLDNTDIRLYDNCNEEAGACILCWRAESFYKTQQAFSLDLYHDFGLAYTIAVIAAKNGVSQIYMHAPTSVPLVSYATTAKHYNSILARNYYLVDNISLDSLVVHNPVVAFRNRDLSFDIFYDEYNNLQNVARQALSNCAEITSMVHIISRPYMLRDYFAYHLNKLAHNDKGMQMITPVYYQDLKAPSVALLIRLREKGMMIEDVIKYMEGFGITGKNVEEVLNIAICSALGSGKFPHIYSYFSFGAHEEPEFYDDHYHYTRYIRLTNELIYQKVCALTENNIVITGDHKEVLPIPRLSAYNRFLPGQHYSFGGERFEIISIRNGEISVRSEETVEREKEYTSIYNIPFAMLAEEPERTWKRSSYYSRDLFKIKVTRSIQGYFSHTNGLDFYGDNTIRYSLDNAIEETKETYCLRLKLVFPFNSNYDTAAAMLVVLIRGILESALPNNYKDILVVSRLGDNAFDESLFDDAPVNAIRRDPIPSDWLESDDDELPLSQNIKELFQTFGETNLEVNNENEINLYLIDFGEYGSHMLSGIAEETTRLFNVLYGYLDWVIKNPKLKHSYLRFGYHQIPGIFNLPTVYNCLQRIANYSPDVSGTMRGKLINFDLSENVHCSFCGRSIAVSSWQFDDNRIMCEDCYKHRTTERREIQVVLKRAYETLENTYGIKLPEGIKIKFKSATSIRKAGGTGSNGRILGFYNINRREIWVERGGPEPCVLSTLMHELTHAWQYANLDVDKLQKKYIEGHSTYVEIECTRLLGQRVYADFWEKTVLSGNDEYAKGLRYWKDRIKVESDKNIFHHIQEMQGEHGE